MRADVWRGWRRTKQGAFRREVALMLWIALAAVGNDARGASTCAAPLPEWKAMDYGPFLSLTLEVTQGNIANKGIAVRLDPGAGGIAHGHEFFLFDTDTLRAAAGW